MKKQLMLFVASTLLLAGCNNANAITKQFRKKVGSAVEYTEFMTKFSEAVTNLKSGEFWDLISNGTPKSCEIQGAMYVDYEDECKGEDGFARGSINYVNNQAVMKYDEEKNLSYIRSTIDEKCADKMGKEEVYGQTLKATEEEYISEHVTLSIVENTYEMVTSKPTDIPLSAINEVITMFSMMTSAPNTEGSKFSINGSLYTYEVETTAREAYGYDTDDKVTAKYQANIDPNDLFVYTYTDGSKISFIDGTDEINVKKNVNIQYINVKSKDVKLKMPDLSKYTRDVVVM